MTDQPTVDQLAATVGKTLTILEDGSKARLSSVWASYAEDELLLIGRAREELADLAARATQSEAELALRTQQRDNVGRMAAEEAIERNKAEIEVDRLREQRDEWAERLTYVREEAARLREQLDAAWFEERRDTDAAGNQTVSVWCRRCGVEHQRPEHCPARNGSAEARCAQLEQALRHYASEDHWSDVSPPESVNTAGYLVWEYDGGEDLPWKIAREALAGPDTPADDALHFSAPWDKRVSLCGEWNRRVAPMDDKGDVGGERCWTCLQIRDWIASQDTPADSQPKDTA